jgi:ABC-type Fe3+-siderophore transport system permease subunit
MFHADGGTDITKLTVAFRNFTNSPKTATIQNLYHRMLAITMCISSANIYNPWHSSTSSNTGEHSLHTVVAFNGLQLQTAVVYSLSRDSLHKEDIKCLLLLILLPRLSQHFLMHCSTTRAVSSRRYSDASTVYYKLRPFEWRFCP